VAANDPAALIRSRRFLVLLALAAVVGVVASLAAWAFLELVHQTQVGVFEGLPEDLGYGAAPTWWPLPVLGLAGLVVAFAIARLPGDGGHVPANGLNASSTEPAQLPGVILAALATVGLGVVLGPEAPLIALGGGLGLLGVRLVRSDAPPEVGQIVSAAGVFAAVSLIFGSPLIAAVLLIEATGLGGPKLPLVLLPGLLAAGIGSLVSIGMGSFTGLSTSDYALGSLDLPAFARPDAADFGWTILLAAAVAVGVVVVLRVARGLVRPAAARPFVVVPVAGLAVAGVAIAFGLVTDKGAHEVLFSGQDDLNSLVTSAGAWSLGTLALLIALKGVAWSLSLAAFRGGPTFPAMFLGAAAGLMASHLPGYALTPAVAVGMGAAVASVLKLPLSAVVLSVMLTAPAGAGSAPLVIVGVVVAYVLTAVLSAPRTAPALQPRPASPHPGDGVALATAHSAQPGV
jgi:H+/Cl- antiporter ClcA